jgi:hypothetical protein
LLFLPVNIKPVAFAPAFLDIGRNPTLAVRL